MNKNEISLQNSPANTITQEKLQAKFLRSLELTIDSRFEAGKRLKLLSKISFTTTTIISLGLILIPLLDSAGHNAVFSDKTINIFQLFLGVCILVFSVATSIAQYEVRSKDFFECGDKLKVICQEFKLSQIEAQLESAKPLNLREFEKKYREALSGTENHEDIDYIKAQKIRKNKEENLFNSNKLEESNCLISSILIFICNICNICSIFSNLRYYFSKIIIFLAPAILSFLELCFILDMLSITKILSVMHK